MARRRRKINKKTLIILIVITAVVVLGGGGAVAWKKRHTLFPRDPASCAQNAYKEFEAKNYKEAGKEISWAVFYAGRKDDRSEHAKYLVERAKLYHRWSLEDPELSVTQKGGIRKQAMDDLDKASRLDETLIEARQLLFDYLYNDGALAGRPEDIIKAAEQLIRVEEGNHRAHYIRGMFLYNKATKTNDDKDVKASLEAVNRAVQLKPDEVDYRLGKIEVLEWTERFAERDAGEKAFIEALKDLPKNATLRVKYGEYLQRKGRDQEAEEQFRLAMEGDAKSAVGYLKKAQMLTQEQKFAKAMEYVEQAQAINPSETMVYWQKGVLFSLQKQFDQAAEALGQGIDVINENMNKETGGKAFRLRQLRKSFRLLLVDVYANQYVIAETDQAKKELIDLAKGQVEKMAEDDPTGLNAAKSFGRIALLEGDYDTAMEKLEEVYEKAGAQEPQAALMLAEVYLRKELPGKAENVYKTILARPGLRNNPEVMCRLANIKMHYRDWAAAKELIDSALKLDPDNKLGLQLRANLEAATGQGPVPKGKLSPYGVTMVLQRADGLWAEQKRDEALAVVKELYEADPKNLKVVVQLANMHLMLNQKDQAKQILLQASKEYPDNEEIPFQMKLLDATPAQRIQWSMERIDKRFTDPYERALQKAVVYARSGNLDKFNEYLDEAGKIKPDSLVVLRLQYGRALRAKEYDKAIEVAAKVQEQEGGVVNGVLMRAQVELARKEYGKAIELLEEQRESDPESSALQRLLARSYLLNKEYDKAGKLYDVLVSNNPADVTAVIGLAMIAEEKGDINKNTQLVMRAYRNPRGRSNPYIAAKYLEIKEMSEETSDEDVKNIISKRERMVQQQPGDLHNILRLAGLYETRTKQLDKAEATYLLGYKRSEKSPIWARVVVYFYVRTGQPAKADAIIQQGIKAAKKTEDKVAWRILQGKYLSMYDSEKALVVFKQAIKLDPKNPDSHKALSDYYAFQGKWEDAATWMKQYLALSPNDVIGRKALAEYYIRSRQFEQAREVLEGLVSDNPSDVQSRYLQALLAFSEGKTKSAQEKLGEILRENPDYMDGLLLRARLHMVVGDLDSSRLDLEKARGLSSSPQVGMQLAEVYMRLQDATNAEIVLRGILHRDPAFQAALKQLINLYLQQGKWDNAKTEIAKAKKLFAKESFYWLTEANMYRMQGQLNDAVKSLAEAVRIAPDVSYVVQQYLLALADSRRFDEILQYVQANTDRKDWQVWLSAIKARAIAGKGQVAQADEVFLQVLSSAQPQELAFAVGQIRQTYGIRQAIVKLTKWAKSRPQDWYLRMMLGDLYVHATRARDAQVPASKHKEYLEGAAKLYEGARQLAKKRDQKAEIDSRLGNVYYTLQRFKDCERAYLACLEVRKNDIGALNNLAYLYVNDMGQTEKSLPYAKRAHEERPEDPNILDTYGWVLAKLNKLDEAERILLRSVERNPQLPASRYHLGWVLEKTDRKKDARRQYRLGLDLMATKTEDPLHAQLKQAYERVGG